MEGQRRKLRLGDVLLNNGVISSEQLTKALEQQKGSGKKLGEVLVDFTIHFVRALRAARQRRESGQAPQTEWMHEECTP